MKYLSVCSGIEAATVAWHPLGWTPVAFSEIEKFPSEVLKHHYPQVPNVGDMTKFKEWNLDSNVDVFVGGTPCQSFSVAGLRKGLDDPRGNLMLTYLAIADKYRPKWLVWENVAGVLSSNGGKDFGTFLGGLGELGYGFAYRILDAQYFGVAQRRRRVFVVGCLGDWRSAAAVLFERHSLSGHSAPSREKGESSSKYAESGFGTYREDQVEGTTNISSYMSYGLRTRNTTANGIGVQEESSHTLDTSMGLAVAQPITFSSVLSSQHISENSQVSQTLEAKNPMAVAVGVDTYNGAVTGQVSCTVTADVGGATHSGPKVMQEMAVRRLTPVECERLQGFPDNYTDIKPKGKSTPDAPRYKALGNSMAVPVMAWIGKRIQEVENIKCKPNK
jgi:DNA (cytosine-5)-methyltransferase 1